MLAHTGAPAPEGLWTRISASLEEAPPEMDLPMLSSGRSQRGVVDLAERRQRRAPRWLPGAAVAAALVVVAFITGLVVSDGAADGDRSEQIAAPALEDVARRVMNDADATKVVLSSPEGDLEAPAAIDASGSGYLMGNTLPALDESQTYQLWGIKGDLVVSLGVLGASPGVVAFHVGDGVDALAITQEVAGGVVSSANPAFLAGELADPVRPPAPGHPHSSMSVAAGVNTVSSSSSGPGSADQSIAASWARLRRPSRARSTSKSVLVQRTASPSLGPRRIVRFGVTTSTGRLGDQPSRTVSARSPTSSLSRSPGRPSAWRMSCSWVTTSIAAGQMSAAASISAKVAAVPAQRSSTSGVATSASSATWAAVSSSVGRPRIRPAAAHSGSAARWLTTLCTVQPGQVGTGRASSSAPSGRTRSSMRWRAAR